MVKRLLHSIVLAGLAFLGLSASAFADTTYVYTGNPFSSAYGGGVYGLPYTSTSAIDGTLTLAQPLAVGPSTPSFLSFSFTDGGPGDNGFYTSTSPLTQNNDDPYWNPVFDFVTDGSGNITSFDFNIPWSACGGGTYSSGSGDGSGCYSSQSAYNSVQGTWALQSSGASVTPEPGSFALLGTGLLGMAGVVRRRYRKV